jgi:hypothetical protein
MSSTGDAAAAAQIEIEVSGVTLMRYLSVMGMVLVHYDFLLTLDDEVCPIFLYLIFYTPRSLFAGAPRLAREASVAKSPVLHQPLCIHPCNDILQLPLVA